MNKLKCVGCQRELRTDEPAAFLGIPDGEVYPVCAECQAAMDKLVTLKRSCVHGSVCTADCDPDCEDYEIKSEVFTL